MLAKNRKEEKGSENFPKYQRNSLKLWRKNPNWYLRNTLNEQYLNSPLKKANNTDSYGLKETEAIFGQKGKHNVQKNSQSH